MGIQNFFINKKIEAVINKLKKTEPTSIDKIRKIAIIVDENSLFNDFYFKLLQKQIGLDDTHFDILTIKHKKSNYNEFKGNVLLTNEVSWKGELSLPEVKNFLQNQYDLLIDFIAQSEPLKLLVVAKTQSVLKIGFAGNKPELYNILIDVLPEKIEVFMAELVKYLRILKLI